MQTIARLSKDTRFPDLELIRERIEDGATGGKGSKHVTFQAAIRFALHCAFVSAVTNGACRSVLLSILPVLVGACLGYYVSIARPVILHRSGSSHTAAETDLDLQVSSASLARVIEIIETTSGSAPINVLLRGVSDATLVGALDGLSAAYWRDNRSAEDLLRETGKRLFSKQPGRGLNAAVEFLNRRQLAGSPFIGFRAMIEGCFWESAPDVASTVPIFASLNKQQALVVMEIYFDMCNAQSLSDFRHIAGELSAAKDEVRKNPADIRQVQTMACRSWLLRGAPGLEELDASTHATFKELSSAVREGIRQLAAFDPAKAIDLIGVIGSRDPGLAGEMFVESGLRFRELLTLARHLPETGREAFWSRIRKRWEAGSPLLLRQLFDEVPVAAVPGKIVSEIIADSVLTSLPYAIQWLSSLGRERTAQILDEATQSRNWQDPAVIDSFLAIRLPLGNVTADGVLPKLRVLANSNRERAEMYVGMLPETMRKSARDLVLATAISQTAMKSPDEFVAELAVVPKDAREAILLSTAKLAGPSGKIDVIEIAQRLPPGEKERLLNEVLRSAAQRQVGCAMSFDAAKAIAAELLSWGFQDEYANGIVSVAAMVGRSNPREALSFAEKLPAGEHRDRALVSVVERWVQSDAPAVCAWAESLSPGQERDLVISSIVNSAPTELNTVLRSIQAIQDRGLRIQTLQTLARAWSRADPQRFEAQLRISGVSESDQNALQPTAGVQQE